MRLHTFHIWTLSLAVVVFLAYLLLIQGRSLAIVPGVTEIPETFCSTGTISVVPAQTSQIVHSMRETEETADDGDQSQIFLHFK